MDYNVSKNELFYNILYKILTILIKYTFINTKRLTFSGVSIEIRDNRIWWFGQMRKKHN